MFNRLALILIVALGGAGLAMQIAKTMKAPKYVEAGMPTRKMVRLLQPQSS